MTTTKEDAVNEQDVLEKIRQTLVQIKVPGGGDAQPANTFEELDVDSLDLVELVRALEDAYGIQVPDERLEGVESVGDAVALTLDLARGGAPA